MTSKRLLPVSTDSVIMLNMELRVRVRGMTIELEADDPRARQIEAILLGPPTPEPEPEPEPAPAPEPATPPELPLSPNALAYWDSLEVIDRRLLLLLAEKPRTPMELEQALGLAPHTLHVSHRRINIRARRVAFPLRIHTRGRSRRLRVFRIDKIFAETLRRLAVTPAPV